MLIPYYALSMSSRKRGCQGVMKIISFIEDKEVIEKILRHLGLWKTGNNDPPAGNVSHIPEFIYDEDYSQIPPYDYWLQ